MDTTVTKFLGDYDITIIEFLDTVMPKYLNDNDISVTKFLDRSIGQFLSANDITVTKFLEDKDDNDISVTKFLQDSENYFPVHHSQRRYYKPDRRFAHDPDFREHTRGWEADLHHSPRHYEAAEYYHGYEHAPTVYPGELYHHQDYEHARTVYPVEHHDDHHGYERARTVYPTEHHAPYGGYGNPHHMNRSEAPDQKKDKK